MNLDANFVKEILADRKAILHRLWIGKFWFVTPQCGWWTLYMLLWLIQVLSGLMDLKCRPRMSFCSTWCNSVIILLFMAGGKTETDLKTVLCVWVCHFETYVGLFGPSIWEYSVHCSFYTLNVIKNLLLRLESGILELFLGGFRLFCTR